MKGYGWGMEQEEQLPVTKVRGPLPDEDPYGIISPLEDRRRAVHGSLEFIEGQDDDGGPADLQGAVRELPHHEIGPDPCNDKE